MFPSEQDAPATGRGIFGVPLGKTITVTDVDESLLLSVPEGISLIHVPLKVTAVDGVDMTIESVGDLYDALGGSETVGLLITYNTDPQRWSSYIGSQDNGKPADRVLTDDLGIIASALSTNKLWVKWGDRNRVFKKKLGFFSQN